MEPKQYDLRPDPDALLAQLEPEPIEKTGRLKIFFGYAAGVGKTYAMLDEARELYRAGVDVIIGYIEPHTRQRPRSSRKACRAFRRKPLLIAT